MHVLKIFYATSVLLMFASNAWADNTVPLAAASASPDDPKTPSAEQSVSLAAPAMTATANPTAQFGSLAAKPTRWLAAQAYVGATGKVVNRGGRYVFEADHKSAIQLPVPWVSWGDIGRKTNEADGQWLTKAEMLKLENVRNAAQKESIIDNVAYSFAPLKVLHFPKMSGKVYAHNAKGLVGSLDLSATAQTKIDLAGISSSQGFDMHRAYMLHQLPAEVNYEGKNVAQSKSVALRHQQGQASVWALFAPIKPQLLDLHAKAGKTPVQVFSNLVGDDPYIGPMLPAPREIATKINRDLAAAQTKHDAGWRAVYEKDFKDNPEQLKQSTQRATDLFTKERDPKTNKNYDGQTLEQFIDKYLYSARRSFKPCSVFAHPLDRSATRTVYSVLCSKEMFENLTGGAFGLYELNEKGEPQLVRYTAHIPANRSNSGKAETKTITLSNWISAANQEGSYNFEYQYLQAVADLNPANHGKPNALAQVILMETTHHESPYMPVVYTPSKVAGGVWQRRALDVVQMWQY